MVLRETAGLPDPGGAVCVKFSLAILEGTTFSYMN